MTRPPARSLIGALTTAAVLMWMGAGSAAAPTALLAVSSAAVPAPAESPTFASSAVLTPMAGATPTAQPDSYATPVDQSLSVPPPGLLANDTDPEGDRLSAVLDVGPVNGSLTLISSGGFVYSPNPGFSGTDTFTYVAGDGTSQSAPTQVSVAVGGVAPPVSTTLPVPPSTTVPSTTVPPTTLPPTTLPPTPIAVIYANSCGGCHGSAGQGGVGPALAGTSLARSAFVAVTNDGAGSMPGFSTSITATDVDLLYDYVVALGDGGVEPPPVPVGPEALYLSACGSCHGADGTGSVLGPGILGEGVAETISVVRTGDDSMPAFGPESITDDALAELATYVAALGGGDGGGDGGRSDGSESDDHSDDADHDEGDDSDADADDSDDSDDSDDESDHDESHDGDTDPDDESDSGEAGSTVVVERDDDEADRPEDNP